MRDVVFEEDVPPNCVPPDALIVLYLTGGFVANQSLTINSHNCPKSIPVFKCFVIKLRENKVRYHDIQLREIRTSFNDWKLGPGLPTHQRIC